MGQPLTEAQKKRQRAYQARWRKAHPNYGRKWRKKNPKKVLGYKKRWRRRPGNAKHEEAVALARKNAAQNR